MKPKKTSDRRSSATDEPIRLELVLKSDVSGTEEAVAAAIKGINVPGVLIDLIQTGIGNVSKSDLLMARTGSRLVIGFNVEVMPKMEQLVKEYGVEVRLYDTIYRLTEDLKHIAASFTVQAPEEKVTGKAKIIATFKARGQGIIIGCEVLDGTLEIGKNFRVITAMGPVYCGKISSLQVERKNVKIGKPDQQVGIQITDWNKARVDDLVECFETIQTAGGGPWRPRGRIFRSTA